MPGGERALAAAYVQDWFEGNATGELTAVTKAIWMYPMLTPRVRAAATTVVAGYAAEHLGALPARLRTALAQTCDLAPTPSDPYAHIYAAMLADAWCSKNVTRMIQVKRWAKSCSGPVLPDIVWVCLRTAAAFVWPGSPVALSAPGCQCEDGDVAAAKLSGWAADVAAGKPGMREFLHLQVEQHATREEAVADHMVTCAIMLLAAASNPETS